jgi:uncharacterized protein
VNPRPTATFDLSLPAASAFSAHVTAGAALSPSSERVAGARGHVVVYAPHPIQIPKSLNWPDWCADRPSTGDSIPDGAPVCTLIAEAASASAVEALLHQRLAWLWQLLAINADE